ncbi:U1 small nuclear ribonucleoprotein A-like [Argiope bruennichi]|nr:U1 small nuclear ribonucleoprotein A-like [Argiope bruennichi]
MLDQVVAPNHTIYINNLNEKIKKDELKRSLTAVFSQFGKILDIVAMQTLKMRGQAFVVFDDIKSATAALTTMQSFPFYDKPMRIQYAKTDSDVIAKRKGTYIERVKEPRPEPGEKKRHRGDLKEIKRKKAKEMQMQLLQPLLPGIPAGAMVPTLIPTLFSGHQSIPLQTMPQAQTAAMTAGTTTTTSTSVVSDQPPNQILFVTNVPKEATDAMLTILFSQFPGFKEVRLAPGRHDIAFVEFENEILASTAKDSLQGFKLTPTNPINITFANK